MDAADIQSLATALNALGSTASVNPVSLQLPSFWSEDPELWFLKVEAQFALRKVNTDDTKYNYVVSALDNRASIEIKSVLLQPPSKDKYNAVKSALITAFAKTQAEKDAELLTISGLGDRKPSALLRHILSLNSDADTLRRAFFLAQLPSDVRAILAVQDNSNLDELAQAADRIVEAKVLAGPADVAPLSEVSFVHGRRQNGRKSSPMRRKSDPNICYYHSKFGTRARVCKPGCLFADLVDLSVKHDPSAKTLGNAPAGR